MCARCFLPVKKKYSRALILMKDEIEAFLPLTYNSFSIDSLQFNNHVLKHFLRLKMAAFHLQSETDM